MTHNIDDREDLKKYSIVQYEDGLQIIPSCWMDDKKETSIWPQFVRSLHNLEKLIIRAEIPNGDDTWTSCNILRWFGSTDDWSRAKEKLIEAEDNSILIDSAVLLDDEISDARSGEIFSPTMRHNRIIFTPEDACEQKESTVTIRSQRVNTSTPKKDNNLSTQAHRSFAEVSKISSRIDRQAEYSNVTIHSQKPGTSTPKNNNSLSPQSHRSFAGVSEISSGINTQAEYSNVIAAARNVNEQTKYCIPTAAFRKFMMKSMATVVAELKDIKKRMEILEKRPEEPQLENFDEEISQMCNDAELAAFEKKLENKAFFTKMIGVLKIIGPGKISACVFQICGMLFADDLAVKYSWVGRQKKKVFRDLRTAKLIRQTLRVLLKDMQEVQFVDGISKWLAQARTRIIRRKAKLQLAEDVENTDEENSVDDVEGVY